MKPPTLRVLIAEDDLGARERLRLLAGEAQSVDVIASAGYGDEALDQVRWFAPDALILDLELPGMHGLDVLRTVKEQMPNTVVVVCTNHSEDEYREYCESLGADHVLDKTMEIDQLPMLLAKIHDRLFAQPPRH